jgi:hypothetical protein
MVAAWVVAGRFSDRANLRAVRVSDPDEDVLDALARRPGCV